LIVRVSGAAEGAAFVGDLLAYKGAVPADTAPTHPALITINVQEVPALSSPEVPSSALTLGDGPVWTWTTPGGPRVATEGAEAQVNSQTGTITVRLRPGFLSTAQRRTAGFYLLTTALLYVLAAREQAVLHAAALVPPPVSGTDLQPSSAASANGLLLVADSDSGKSTTALTLIRQGWRYVSDDTVLLYRHGSSGTGLAGSYRRDVCVDPDAAGLFPELAGPTWPASPSDPSKWRVDLDRVYGSRFLAACTPRVLLFPELMPAAPSSLTPVDGRQALQRLVRQSSLPLLASQPAMAQGLLDALTQLVAQTACYRLTVGRDLLDGPRAHALLAGLL
jgi:hypothetical protein